MPRSNPGQLVHLFDQSVPSGWCYWLMTMDADFQSQDVNIFATGRSAAPPSAASVAQAAGERRYLTVLFWDLVGSTNISARLDAEEWRSSLVQLAKVLKVEVGEAGAFDNRPRPREEALKKLEERAGADARRLFEAFLRKIDKLQEASASRKPPRSAP
jgi:class 3 adenylate cyclase